MARLPEALGVWPAVVVITALFAFLLADVAPDDPARIAYLVGGYWAATLILLLIFGETWMRQGEAISVLFRAFGDLAPLSLSSGGVGAPGWRLVARW